jgi:hypothetical protein
VGAQHIGLDLMPSLGHEALDPMQPAEADQLKVAGVVA